MRPSHKQPVPSPQPAAPSAEVLALRRNWKWAYLSHFLFTYNPVLHLEDIQLSELEDDLATGTMEVIPTVMQRLLTSLTPHDKRMILEDWQHQLRRQSLKRAPDHNLMGTEDNPTDFSSLIMSDKLDLFQALCEWQFHNPNNLRARMRDDDEYATWRMEPIAYDAKGNAYWLMGGNRLWIQYAPPHKRTAKSHKRKQPATPCTNGRKLAKRKQPAPIPSSRAMASISSTNAKSKVSMSKATSGVSMRETRSRGQQTGPSADRKPRTLGTRVSTRLRGREEEEIWQAIPDEWLKEGAKDVTAESEDENKGNPNGMENDMEPNEIGLKSLDDISELTSLSDLSELPDIEEETNEDVDSTPTPPPDFSSSIEDVWETICITLADWEKFPQRFEKATHRSEKQFYNILVTELVPMITEVLRVDVRKKVMEEAVVHRKRSSRIAVKESVREAERAEARRKAEEEKEMERHRRWEARARKEEEEQVKRENMRSTRLREKGRTGSESVDIDITGGEPESKPVLANGSAIGMYPSVATPLPVKFVVNVSKSGTQTPKDDEAWELHCEICHRRGMNLDDGQELMSCERCNKWQHIRCHDQADFIAGRPRRNWELVDFLCAACTAKSQSPLYGVPSQPQPQPQPHRHDSQPWSHSGGKTSSNGVTPKALQPVSSKSIYKRPPYETAPYSNGRTHYSLPQAHTQQIHPTSAAPSAQYVNRVQSSTMASGHSMHPTSASSVPPPASSAPPPASSVPPPTSSRPYASGPNMYLSSYAGNSRPQQTPVQPSQSSSSSQYRSTIPVTQTGVWSQQQVHYSQLATHQAWNGTTHTSGSQPYIASGTNGSHAVPVQPNRYYRPHPTAPSNPLPPTHQYYTGGPSTQS